MEQYYRRNWLEVVGLLESNVNKGLLEYDCILRREKYGDNVINLGNESGKVAIVKDLLKKKYIYVSILVSLLFLLNGLNILSLINFLLLLLNIAFKVHYELKSQKDLDILQNLNKSKVLVLREGIQRIIEAGELVKGDIVILKKESFISADLRIIESNGLKVDERNVTGEEFIKEKYESKIHGQVSSLGEVNNMLFRGSSVKDGTGVAIVVETGKNTEIGRLLSMINRNNSNKHIILKNVEDIALKSMLCLVLVNLIIYLISPGAIIKKQEIFMYGLFAIVSICMPVITIGYNKIVKKKLKEDKIDIINFSSFNLVNDINVIFIDKIGNITKDELYFEKIYTNEKVFETRKIDTKDINIRRILDISLLCNDAKYNIDQTYSKGDMYEIAYIKYCIEQGIFKATIDGKNKRKFEIQKDTNKRVITTVNKCSKGYRANSRGTIEDVLGLCTHILINGVERELTAKDIERIKFADLSFSREGLVTEAFAYRSFSYEPSKLENIESNLVFVGLIALAEVFVTGISEDIQRLKDNGILPIVFTDDNKILAEMVGKKIGLVSSSNEVISAVELSYLSGSELYKVISRTKVFCRLTPELKIKIISIFNSDGYKVCVEGENLGDLSVVNSAHLSIVKGKSSTLVKQGGDLYVKENPLKSFFKVIEEGRLVNEGMKNGIKVYSTLIIGEIIALNAYYALVDSKLFGIYTLLFMNLFLLTPIILLVMNSGREELNKKKAFIRGVIFSVLPTISILFLSEFNEFAMYMILGGMTITYGIVNSKLSFRTFNIGVKLLFLSILIYIVGAFSIGFMDSVVYSENLAIIIGGIIIIYLVCDLIITKWQDS